MKLNDSENRRGLLKKAMFFVAGFFSSNIEKVLASDKVNSFPNINNFTESVLLTDLALRKSKTVGELVFVYSINSDKLLRGFSGFFRSTEMSTVVPDGLINVHGPNCIWSRVLDDRIYVEWFGAYGDGITDDSSPLNLANQFANEKQLPLYFSSNKKYLLSGSFEIDVAKTSWHGGDKSLLQWTKAPREFALRVFSSQSTYSRTRVNNKVAISDLTVLGGGIRDLYQSKALSVGGREKSSSLFSIRNINFQGWEVNLFFDDNSWRIKIEDCLFLWGKIISKPFAVNSGECMYFNNCMLADNFSSTELHTGDWHFIACSIDNHEIKVYGDASVYFNNGHIENPGRKSDKFTAVGIYSENASASITNTRLIISDTPNTISTPIFYVMDKNKSLGLYLNNLRYDQKKNFDPSVSDAKGVFLVGGRGKVVIDNVFTNMIDSNFIALSRNSNSLFANQSFESGLENWNNSGQVKIQNDLCYVSQNCLQLVGISSVQQEVVVKAGDVFTGGVWVKFSSLERALMKISIIFLDAYGKEIKSSGYEFKRFTSFEWEWIRLGAVVPDRSLKCQLTISLLSNTNANSEVYIDGLVINKTNK